MSDGGEGGQGGKGGEGEPGGAGGKGGEGGKGGDVHNPLPVIITGIQETTYRGSLRFIAVMLTVIAFILLMNLLERCI